MHFGTVFFFNQTFKVTVKQNERSGRKYLRSFETSFSPVGIDLWDSYSQDATKVMENIINFTLECRNIWLWTIISIRSTCICNDDDRSEAVLLVNMKGFSYKGRRRLSPLSKRQSVQGVTTMWLFCGFWQPTNNGGNEWVKNHLSRNLGTTMSWKWNEVLLRNPITTSKTICEGNK